MKPTVGRIVHFTSYGDYPHAPVAALITGVNADATVWLKVFYRTGIIDKEDIAFSEQPQPGCWSWPPREAA